MFRFAPFCFLQLALLDLEYFRAKIGDILHQSESMRTGLLDDITGLRTFVRIVRTRSLSAAGREMGLVLNVVIKRLATLERRTEARLVAFARLVPTVRRISGEGQTKGLR